MFNRCNDMSDVETCLAPLHLLIQGNVSEDAVYCEYWTNHANCLAPITSLIFVNIVNILNILNTVNIMYVVTFGQTMPTIPAPSTSLIILNIANILNILNIVNILYAVNIGQTMPTITAPISSLII